MNALALSRTYHRSMPSAQKLYLVLWRAFERIHGFEGLVVSKEALSCCSHVSTAFHKVLRSFGRVCSFSHRWRGARISSRTGLALNILVSIADFGLTPEPEGAK